MGQGAITTQRPAIKPELLKVRPYSHRNNHTVVEVLYAGVSFGDMCVPGFSTLAVYDEFARATVKREWSQLSAHKQINILDAEREQLALRELEGVTYISVSDKNGRMDDELFDMLSEAEQQQSNTNQ